MTSDRRRTASTLALCAALALPALLAPTGALAQADVLDEALPSDLTDADLDKIPSGELTAADLAAADAEARRLILQQEALYARTGRVFSAPSRQVVLSQVLARKAAERKAAAERARKRAAAQAAAAAKPLPPDPLASRATLRYGQQIALDNGELIGVTPFDFSLRKSTRTDSLALVLSLPLEERPNPEDGRDALRLASPFLSLSHTRQIKGGSLETELSYRETDLNRSGLGGLAPLPNPDGSTDRITVDSGRQETTAGRVALSLGREAPLGTDVTLSASRTHYRDTTDPDLHDSFSRGVDASVAADVTPRLRARVVASASRTDSDGGTDSRSTRLGLGARLRISEATDLDAELSQTRITRDRPALTPLTPATRTTTEGLALRLSASHKVGDGDWRLSYTTSPASGGRRDELMLSRSLNRPNQQLSFGLGVSRLEGNDPDPIFQLAYSTAPDRLSKLSLSLARRATTDSDGEESLSTDLGARYDRQLTALSTLGARIDYQETRVLTGPEGDSHKIALDVSYTHALDRNLSVVAGYNRTRGKSSSGRHSDDDRLYLGLSRSFDWRP